jgi:REP element-mobilizing transposase RayT
MELAKRKSPRATWLDYNEGEYFVTVCTQGHKHFFGNIHQGKMLLSEIGKHLVACIENTPHHQPHIRIVQYVVMPNHFHAIIKVEPQPDTPCRVPTKADRLEQKIKIQRLPLLSAYIGILKSSVTKFANENSIQFAWQPRFHDHIIRGIEDRNNISQYIENNILNWETDCFYKNS